MRTEVRPFSVSFAEAKQRAIKKRQEEIRDLTAGKRPWRTWNTNVVEYEQITFAHVLPESFTDFLTRRRAQKGKVFALDVMGQGKFFPDYPVDGEVVITLYDDRSDKQKEIDEVNNRLVIEGSVLDGKTWAKAYQFIKEHDDTEFPGFDLITCRPVGGWRTVMGDTLSIPRDHMYLLEWIPIQRMFGIMSTGGRLTVEMLSDLDAVAVQWANDLEFVPGIETKSYGETFRLDKITNETKILPRI